jgi:hypothetical protein
LAGGARRRGVRGEVDAGARVAAEVLGDVAELLTGTASSEEDRR